MRGWPRGGPHSQRPLCRWWSAPPSATAAAASACTSPGCWCPWQCGRPTSGQQQQLGCRPAVQLQQAALGPGGRARGQVDLPVLGGCPGQAGLGRGCATLRIRPCGCQQQAARPRHGAGARQALAHRPLGVLRRAGVWALALRTEPCQSSAGRHLAGPEAALQVRVAIPDRQGRRLAQGRDLAPVQQLAQRLGPAALPVGGCCPVCARA